MTPSRYSVAIPEQDKNDEDKTHWCTVGSAFPMKERDGFSIVLHDNVAVSGNFCLFPATDEAPKKNGKSRNRR